MQSNLIKQVFKIFLFLFLLVACQPSTEYVPLTKTPAIIPSLTPSSTPTPTPTPTSVKYSGIRVISRTPSLTPTVTPTDISFTPLWTPLPTIPPQEVASYLKQLVSEDPDCYLPCWMGITPGETTIEEAWQLLAPFASDLYTWRTQISMWLDFEKYDDLGLISPSLYNTEMITQFVIKDEVVSVIYANIFGAKDRYPLQTVLNTYGKPSEIWFGVSALANWNGSLNLHYSDVGMNLHYVSYIDVVDVPEGDQIVFCFQEVYHYAELWNPNLNLSYYNLHDTLWRLPLEEAIGMSIDEFYFNFKNADQACIETSKEMWKKIWQLNPPQLHTPQVRP